MSLLIGARPAQGLQKVPNDVSFILADERYIEVRRWNPTDSPDLSYPVYRAEKGEVIHVPANTRREGDWLLVPGFSLNGLIKSVWVRSPKKAALIDPNTLTYSIDPAAGTREATVFSTYGKTYKACEAATGDKSRAKGGSPCVAWPNATAKIKILDSMFAEVDHPIDHQNKWQLFYEIEYSYVPTKGGQARTGKGWINAKDLKLADEVEIAAAEAKLPLPTPVCTPKVTELPNQNDIDGVSEETAAMSVDVLADMLAPHMGLCLLDKKSEVPVLKEKSSAYDQTLLAHWKKQTPPATLTGFDGQPIPKADLVAIDTMARTLYGEMANCFGRGTQYPMAVARIASNRADFVAANPKRRGIFAAGKSHELKSPISAVLSSPYQFTTWNRQLDGEPNASLKHVLCPPANAKKKMWTGFLPGSRELDIWKQSLAIATEAVLSPKTFKERTKQVTQYYYTSGLGEFHEGFKRVYPTVEGKKLTRGSCIEVWKGPDP